MQPELIKNKLIERGGGKGLLGLWKVIILCILVSAFSDAHLQAAFPQAVSVSPSTPNPSAGLGPVDFQFAYADSDGDLKEALAAFSPSTLIQYPNQCVVYIWLQGATSSATVYLANDQGTQYPFSGVTGNSGTLQNSQCSINLAGSSVLTSGNTKTVTLRISFSASYAGSYNTMMWVADQNNGTSGQIDRGDWLVVPTAGTPPTHSSLSPSAGSGAGPVNFEYTVFDADGASTITQTNLFLRAQGSLLPMPAQTCWAVVSGSGFVNLYNNALNAWAGSGQIGSQLVLNNGSCEINLQNSSRTVGSNSITFRLSIGFTPLFAGLKNSWLRSFDNGGNSSDWVDAGDWLVEFVGQPAVEVSCDLQTSGGAATARPTSNSFVGSLSLYPRLTVKGNWIVTVRLLRRFQPAGSTVWTDFAPLSQTVSWSPSTPVGQQSSGRVSITAPPIVLEQYGSGKYESRIEATGRCNSVNAPLVPDAGSSLVSSREISRPSAPNYSSPDTFLAFSGQNLVDDFSSGPIYSATPTKNFKNTIQLTPGDPNGATGSPTWVLLQSSPGYAQITASGPSAASITALKSSDECGIFNVHVKTSWGGFLSEPLLIFIDRPYRFVKPSALNIPNSDDDVQSTLDIVGYYNRVFYAAQGLCNQTLEDRDNVLFGIAYNEQFGPEYLSGLFNNWPTNAGGVKLGNSSSRITDNIRVLAGAYCGPSQVDICTPEPDWLGESSLLVTAYPQTWRTGSTTPGSGIVVQQNDLMRYIDNGKHANVVSPSN